MVTRELEGPFTKSKVAGLRCGQLVRLSGRTVVAHNGACKLIEDHADAVDLTDAAVFYCGPLMRKQDGAWTAVSAGPTVSGRLDAFSTVFFQRGAGVIIGGGAVGEAVRAACAASGGVYLQAVAGAAATIGSALGQARDVMFLKEPVTADAIWGFEAQGLEAVVAIDSRGRSLHRRVRAGSRRRLESMR